MSCAFAGPAGCRRSPAAGASWTSTDLHGPSHRDLGRRRRRGARRAADPHVRSVGGGGSCRVAARPGAGHFSHAPPGEPADLETTRHGDAAPARRSSHLDQERHETEALNRYASRYPEPNPGHRPVADHPARLPVLSLRRRCPILLRCATRTGRSGIRRHRRRRNRGAGHQRRSGRPRPLDPGCTGQLGRRGRHQPGRGHRRNPPRSD